MPQYLALTYHRRTWTGGRLSRRTSWPSTGSSASTTPPGSRRAPSCTRPSTATVVRVEGARGGPLITTDGPYAETKEALTGYYLIEAEDLEEAVAIRGGAPGGLGAARVEVRPVILGEVVDQRYDAVARKRSGSRGPASSRR